MQNTDTIAAIASALNDAGIGIVRVSGEKAIEACEEILADARMRHGLSAREANTIRFAYVLREDGSILDEALVSVMRAPHSYTGEDVVEINVHGGAFVLKETLARVLRGTGGRVRPAEPGEFTKRAFLNGKMDLSAAEAVQDMISSQHDFALRNAAKQLRGVLGNNIRGMRESLLSECALIEASLDDPDVYAQELEGYGERLSAVLSRTEEEIDRLLSRAEEGMLLKDGIRCAIIGAPNTGKSTLLNLLLGRDRAIVTDLPGTTRDVLREQLFLGEFPLLLSDTAGIRQTEDAAEAIGVTRAKEEAEDAALVLLVADMTKPLEEAKESLKSVRKETPVLLLLNKADLLSEEACHAAKEAAKRFFAEEGKVREVLPASFLKGEGTDALREAVTALFLKERTVPRGEYFLTSERHKEALLAAKEAFARLKKSIAEEVSEEFYVVDLMAAVQALSQITGEDASEELIERIFSEFCMGK
ncbi:MAG: tRNA uridine-5-carboxymethylaminomethyl(34) synthesis GTPase MnmE [Lachnospiraceae bacterium]|nr:tRNA uridine-5-carboxymethylaminomethyl(34) synthesis GTPase MnmE [Lachnospiraceae bacterium]